MATVISGPVLGERRRWWRHVFLYLAVILLLALLGTVGSIYHMVRAPLPQLDGTIRVPGLSADVRVIRDGHGIPTIEAANLDDLFFAQGYVTAQDRLWQMDIMKRFAAGEIAEILGPDLLKHDREQRILGLRAAAKNALEKLPARELHFLDAYAKGVNAYMNSSRDHLPIEFRILKYTPQPWSAEDSLIMHARMVQDLNHGQYRAALQHEKILAKLGPQLTAELYVNSSWRDRPPSSASLRMEEDQRNGNNDQDEEEEEPMSDSPQAITRLLSGHKEAAGRSEWADEVKLIAGSNNWVVGGGHTITGKPLLSNDMHLGHQMPNLWYEAHLRCGDYDVAGVTLPGVPFVIVGHNQRIAWGFTNVGPTVEDVYVENFNEQGQYQTPAGWKDAVHRTETIRVKGRPDVTVDVTVTRHGPIITDLVPGESRKIALKWTLYDALNNPFFDLNSAKNWEEFRKALSIWDAPSQNTVYADVDGHIGYQATGHIPVRQSGDGGLPVNGADDAHEWKNYVPFDDLPRVYDPPSGIIATANGRITPDGYKYSLSSEWGSPWRTERILRVLNSGKKFGPADMLSLQTDIMSAFDRYCAERFVYSLDHVNHVSDGAQQAREILRDWTGQMAADSSAPTIETVARGELLRLILEPKLGVASKEESSGTLSWKDYRWGMSSIWLENVLIKQPARWLPPGYTNYDELLAAAVEAAVKHPDAPKDLKNWAWGSFSPIDIEHPILSRIPVLGRWTGPGLHPQSGGGYTVKQVGKTFGPSERLTVNLAALDQSTLNTVMGQSGNLSSPYYMDQWNTWYEGTTLLFPFSIEAIQRTKSHELVLKSPK
jgi:penicillin amidase